jgi:hypothetical protein
LKKVNKWQLHEIIIKIIAVADRPATTSVFAILIKIL